MILYHFTSTAHLPLIRAAGFLRPSETNLSMFQAHAGPDAVWFLDEPELSAPHGLLGSAHDKTAVRFTVDVPDKQVVNWMAWADAQGMEMDWRRIMIESGGGFDAAARWFLVFRPVPESRWLEVRVRGE